MELVSFLFIIIGRSTYINFCIEFSNLRYNYKKAYGYLALKKLAKFCEYSQNTNVKRILILKMDID